MIFFAILSKAVVWIIAFRSAIRTDARAMLLRCSAVAVVLTAIDIFSVAANLRVSAFVLTLVLYLLMSFTLIPCAWKLRNTLATLILGAVGALGALAGVNFTMDLLRGLVPFLNR
ncbi:hypothetical protein KP004_10150 [Geomonas oryzisoli]|uniref:Uncharacterized protein n=1 Tax=Geomonas oryzisoli TaxID=2847992 RepID=A0ABX8JJ58_9BACT|nr:hypothetical protein [Geomonas oryzisoli]QWV95505.1 hypothetical protein KP004_10150 [Geomonas oryzisoli]